MITTTDNSKAYRLSIVIGILAAGLLLGVYLYKTRQVATLAQYASETVPFTEVLDRFGVELGTSTLPSIVCLKSRLGDVGNASLDWQISCGSVNNHDYYAGLFWKRPDLQKIDFQQRVINRFLKDRSTGENKLTGNFVCKENTSLTDNTKMRSVLVDCSTAINASSTILYTSFIYSYPAESLALDAMPIVVISGENKTIVENEIQTLYKNIRVSQPKSTSLLEGLVSIAHASGGSGGSGGDGGGGSTGGVGGDSGSGDPASGPVGDCHNQGCGGYYPPAPEPPATTPPTELGFCDYFPWACGPTPPTPIAIPPTPAPCSGCDCPGACPPCDYCGCPGVTCGPYGGTTCTTSTADAGGGCISITTSCTDGSYDSSVSCPTPSGGSGGGGGDSSPSPTPTPAPSPSGHGSSSCASSPAPAARFVTGITIGSVWGTNSGNGYTTDSTLGKVATHAGLMGPGVIDYLTTIQLGNKSSFTGTAGDYGVTSMSSGSAWCGMTVDYGTPPGEPVASTTATPATNILFTLTPTTLSQAGLATMFFVITNPTTQCLMRALPYVTNDPVNQTTRNADAQRITTLLQTRTTRTDVNDPYNGIYTGGRRLSKALSLPDPVTNDGKARGKKAVLVNYSTIFEVSCDGYSTKKVQIVKLTKEKEI